jgi:hypothetical protein
MMAVIIVEDPALGQSLTLDTRQTDMCVEAIKDATRRPFWDWLLNLFGLLRTVTSTGWPVEVTPDLVIRIDDGGHFETWHVSGRFVLQRPGEEEGHQFYFALLLVEWLEQAPVPTP